MDQNNLKYYQIAGMNMSIQGEGAYTEALQSYFQAAEVSVPSDPILLSVIIEDDPAKVAISAKYYSLSGKISFNNTDYCVREPGFVYSVLHLFDDTEPVVLKVCCTRKKSLRSQIGILINSHGIGLERIEDRFVDSIMNYSCFFYLFPVLLMRQNKVFLHCGIAENAGKAFVMCGTGGCGKTSTLMELLSKEGFKYMAEDFGILGNDGMAYYMPKKMAIYQSDAKYKNPDVVKGLRKLPLTYRAHWKFFELCKQNPRYRFTPKELFGEERVAKEGTLDKVIYLSRVREDVPLTYSDISIEELCSKIRHASFRELKQLSEILNNIRAVGDAEIRNSYPELAQLEARYEQLLREGLTGKKIGLLEVPLKADPSEIVDAMLDESSNNEDQKEDGKR